MHACVRSTALDAYERGFEVAIADDAVGSTEPVHAETTRTWLAARVASFASVAELLGALGDAGEAETHAGGATTLPVAVIAGAPRAGGRGRWIHRDPCRTARVLAAVPLGGTAEVDVAGPVAAAAQRVWARVAPADRAGLLDRWAAELDSDRARFVDLLVREIGKPRRAAEEEVGRAAAHARIAAELVRDTRAVPVAPGVTAVPRPVGVVGLVTPWNNPLAIPVGKIAPAIGFGNGVVLKPAPQGSLDGARAAGNARTGRRAGGSGERRVRGHRRRARAVPRPARRRGLGHRVDRDGARRSPRSRRTR